MSHNLHVYLNQTVSPREAANTFTSWGYVFDRTWESEDTVESDCQYWEWKHHPLSKGGVELLFFNRAFTDNVRFSEYSSSVLLRGALDGSEIDLAMVDITALLLLRKFGGVLHNTQRTDRKVANLFLCGVNNTKFPPKNRL